MEQNTVYQAVESALQAKQSFCKFLSANDTGETGGHQAGIYISKPSISIMFDEPGIKGQNKEKWVRIHWMDGNETKSRFIYYGQGTRNEYRITNFGKGFPYLRPEYTGALFILSQISPEDYQAFILNTEDEVNQFLDAFGMSATETNRLLDVCGASEEAREQMEINRFIASLDVEFPASAEMAKAARMIAFKVYMNQSMVKNDPDGALLQWTEEEYRLFRALENTRYSNMINGGLRSVDDFIVSANMVLNRRKSRAGKSLEHHLSAIFDENNIQYTAQGITEGNKKPDFIFPSVEAYHDLTFAVNKLCTLAAKTTCKDRWRQVLNEADRLRDGNKYLCTLQQGISSQQLDEMEAEKVILVVPKPYIKSYPRDRQDKIWTIGKFINYVQEMEGI